MKHLRLDTNKCLLCGCIFFSITIFIKLSAVDCDLEDFSQTGPLNIQNCRDHYYKSLNLSATGRKNCNKIIKGHSDEVSAALLENIEVKNKKVFLTDEDYLELTKDCAAFRKVRRYITFSLSNDERKYPIAYSMVIHNDIEMFERLLRSVYMPQNIYCVHVDRKSPVSFHRAVQAVASCFPNVFVASKLEAVIYASWSRVQADLNCMEDLLKSPVQWKYLINTCGADFPIKTNAEIVKALKSLNGKNSMESEVPPVNKKYRWEYHFNVTDDIRLTYIRKSPPPFNVPILSGSAYIVVSRDFVKSLFETAQAQEFLEWAKDTYSPDEFLWASLNRVSWMPGFRPQHSKHDTSDLNALARLVKWGSLEGDTARGAPYSKCTGRHRRDICVYGTGDLHWMLQQHHFFANKFDPNVDDSAIQCLEEYLRFKTFYGTFQ